MVTIYVGTDEHQGAAELTLEYSIRKHSSIPVEFVWMRGSDEGTPWHGWHFNWQYDKEKNNPTFNSRHWHTQFTVFRYAIPEVHEYRGRVIYMDSDIVFLRDIAELFDTPMKAPWKCVSNKRTCVSLINTTEFKDKPWWPSLRAMRSTQTPGTDYRSILTKHQFLDSTLSDAWNCPDGHGYTKNTGALHFTTVETQPWRPCPERVKYRDHARPHVVKIWQRYHDEAVEALRSELEPSLFSQAYDAQRD